MSYTEISKLIEPHIHTINSSNDIKNVSDAENKSFVPKDNIDNNQYSGTQVINDSVTNNVTNNISVNI